jgi:MFS family permease
MDQPGATDSSGACDIPAVEPRARASITKGTALTFVLLLGVVSLFADMTYEGARSITGPYLAVLGASGVVVGIVAGLGELIGYGLRLPFGYLADRMGRYWPITISGYVVNLCAVPLLAVAGRWEVAALLIIAERTGKAIRTPARDAMLSHGTAEMGRGWGFGLHEAMDQMGAMLGPLLVAAVLFLGGSYERGFAILLIPAALVIVVLVAARRLYPEPAVLERLTPDLEPADLPREFWVYLAAAFVAAGFADFALISFRFEQESVMRGDLIPIYYAIAMGADALAALVIGRLFDRAGMVVLVLETLVTAAIAPLVFLGGAAAALLGVVLWGPASGRRSRSCGPRWRPWSRRRDGRRRTASSTRATVSSPTGAEPTDAPHHRSPSSPSRWRGMPAAAPASAGPLRAPRSPASHRSVPAPDRGAQ